MTGPSRYRREAAPDYSHRYHAGNVGDVWKHCVLIQALESVSRSSRHAVYVESHAGEGRYALGPTGEWTEGIGRLWDRRPASDLAARYLELCAALGAADSTARRYPGSPSIARAVLGTDAEIRLWERDPATFARLSTHLGASPHTRITAGDGLEALEDEVGRAEAIVEQPIVLVDPPWTRKEDWIGVPDTLARVFHASRRSCLLLWYPIKSLTRPNAMIARLRGAGVPGTIAELTTTPLDERRNRLNGSGMLLLRAPTDAIAGICAAAPVLGECCATQPGEWNVRVQSWTGAAGQA